MKSCKNLKGGLQEVSELLEVRDLEIYYSQNKSRALRSVRCLSLNIAYVQTLDYVMLKNKKKRKINIFRNTQ